MAQSNYSRYNELFEYLKYTLHELPMGVLYDNDGADEKKCKEFMDLTFEFDKLSKLVNEDNDEFIEFCRWHYERYAHYISRHRHIENYGFYINKYGGPHKVGDPIIQKFSNQ